MSQKHLCSIFFYLFLPQFFGKNRKKSANFLQFFLVVYQQVRRNLKKKLVKTLDKILKCCIFAACLKLNKNNKTTTINSNNKKTERNENKRKKH